LEEEEVQDAIKFATKESPAVEKVNLQQDAPKQESNPQVDTTNTENKKEEKLPIESSPQKDITNKSEIKSVEKNEESELENLDKRRSLVEEKRRI